jgi:hypothetical protein
MEQQIRQPGEALGPEEGNVLIGPARLASGVAPLSRDSLRADQIELRQQGHPIHVHTQLRKPLPPATGLLPALLATGCQQLVGQKKGPLALDVLELRQFFRLVMEPAHVLDHRLVAIAAEAFVAIGAAQVLADLAAGAGHQIAVLHSPGGIADHRQAGAVGFLAPRFPRQQAPQGATEAHDRILGNGEAVAPIPVGAEQIDAIEGLQGRLHHADGAGVALRQAVVALVAPLPDAVIGHPVGPGDVVHKVLHEIPLVGGLHHHQPGTGELG